MYHGLCAIRKNNTSTLKVSHFLCEFICLYKKLANDVNVPININRGDR